MSRLELDDEIEVAAVRKIFFERRAKQRQLADMMAPALVLSVGIYSAVARSRSVTCVSGL